MAEKVYWTQRDGSKIDVDQMTLTHLRNTLKMILRANAKKPKAEPKHWSGLRGEIAQDMVDQALEFEYYPDIDDQF
jgi:hypothetical protein